MGTDVILFDEPVKDISDIDIIAISALVMLTLVNRHC